MAEITPLPRRAGGEAPAPETSRAPGLAFPFADFWRAWTEQWSKAMVNLPWSGPVAQNIAPETHWFSPSLEFNIAGNRRIEADVVANVASYGKQLGMVSDALLALAETSTAKHDPAVARLRTLADDIEARKRRHKADADAAARRALDDLRRADARAFAALIAEYGEKA